MYRNFYNAKYDINFGQFSLFCLINFKQNPITNKRPMSKQANQISSSHHLHWLQKLHNFCSKAKIVISHRPNTMLQKLPRHLSDISVLLSWIQPTSRHNAKWNFQELGRLQTSNIMQDLIFCHECIRQLQGEFWEINLALMGQILYSI